MFVNEANLEQQTKNQYLPNTFEIANRTLSQCYLEVGSEKKMPSTHYHPASDGFRVFRDVLEYAYIDDDLRSSGCVLNANYFRNIFPFIYFNLEKQRTELRDGTTMLALHYELSGVANANYVAFALVLYEQKVEIIESSEKLMLR